MNKDNYSGEFNEDMKDIKDTLSDHATRDEIIQVHIPDPQRHSDTIFQPKNFLAETQKALKDAFLDWETHHEDYNYIAYITTYKNDIKAILQYMVDAYMGAIEIEQGNNNIDMGDDEENTEGQGGIIDNADNADDDIDDYEFDREKEISTMFMNDNNIVLWRTYMLQNVIIDEEICEELLRILLNREHELQSSVDDKDIFDTEEEYYDKLEKCIDYAYALYPRNAQICCVAGIFYLEERDDLEKSMFFAEKALAFDRTDEEVLMLYTDILYKQNEYWELYEFIHENVSLDPNNYNTGRYDDLVEWYNKLIRASIGVGDIPAQKKYMRKAFDTLDIAANDSGLTHDLIKAVGNGSVSQSKEIKDILQSDHIYVEIQNILHDLLKNCTDSMIHYAIREMEARLDKGNAYYLPLLGDAHSIVGEYKQAIIYYESIDDHNKAGDCYAAMDMHEEAFHSYDLVMSVYIEGENIGEDKEYVDDHSQLENSIEANDVVVTASYEEDDNIDIDMSVFEKAWTSAWAVKDTTDNKEFEERINEICDNAVHIAFNLQLDDIFEQWISRYVDIYYASDYINTHDYEDLCQLPYFWLTLGKKYLKKNDLANAMKSFAYSFDKSMPVLFGLQDTIVKAVHVAKRIGNYDAQLFGLQILQDIEPQNKYISREIKKAAKKAVSRPFQNVIIRKQY